MGLWEVPVSSPNGDTKKKKKAVVHVVPSMKMLYVFASILAILYKITHDWMQGR